MYNTMSLVSARKKKKTQSGNGQKMLLGMGGQGGVPRESSGAETVDGKESAVGQTGERIQTAKSLRMEKLQGGL